MAGQVEVAKQLTKENIPSLPPDELHQFLSTMHMADQDVPISTKGALATLQVSQHLISAEHNREQLSALIRSIKPWPSTDQTEFKTTEPITWRLGLLTGLPEKTRVDWFVESTFEKFLIPLIEQGEDKAARVLEFCTQMIAAWESELDAEVADYTAAVMDICLRCWRVLQNILTFDVAQLCEDSFNDMEFLRKSKDSVHEGPDVLLSVTIDETEFYCTRIEKLLASRGACTRLNPMVAKDGETLKQVAPLGEHTAQTYIELTKVCQNICLYKSELNESTIQNFMSLAQTVLSSVIKEGVIKCETKGKDFDQLKGLQALASEASLAFSLEPEFDALVARLGASSRHLSEQGTKMEFIQLASTVLSAPSDGIKKLLEFKATNPSLHIDDDDLCRPTILQAGHECLRTCAAELQDPSITTTPDSFKAALVINDIMAQDSLPYKGDESLDEALNTWDHAFKAKAALHAFQALGSSPEDMLKADEPDRDEEWPILMNLMKNVSLLMEFRESLGDNDSEEVGTASDILVSNITDLFGKVKDIMLSNHQPHLDAAVAALKPISKGHADGASWTDGLESTCTWDELLQHAEKTLLLVSAQKIIEDRARLEKAQHM